jgi:hypothetical protein
MEESQKTMTTSTLLVVICRMSIRREVEVDAAAVRPVATSELLVIANATAAVRRTM